MSRDWEKELAKIDKQLESISDEALLGGKGAGAPVPAPVPAKPAGKALPAAPAGSAAAPAAPARTRTLGVALRLLLAGAVAVGVLFWPYDARCGLGLAGYLAAVGVVTVAGAWSAVWSWRHRSGRGHVAALVLVGWGVALAAAEVLPRIGYAKADPARALWVCE